ncbi:helix-turn-helix domain-containing protein [Streptomyces olivaceoviridis]
MAGLKVLTLLALKEQPLQAMAKSAGAPAPTARQHLQMLGREAVV